MASPTPDAAKPTMSSETISKAGGHIGAHSVVYEERPTPAFGGGMGAPATAVSTGLKSPPSPDGSYHGFMRRYALDAAIFGPVSLYGPARGLKNLAHFQWRFRSRERAGNEERRPPHGNRGNRRPGNDGPMVAVTAVPVQSYHAHFALAY
jgi:hypothetical protein